MKKTSLADIANALGVSKTLVSMVLNNKGDENGISPDTQKRVLAKAKELNYQPNKFARGLRIGKSNTIGLIVADISNSFYATICRSVEDYAAQKGYQLMICSSDENVEKEINLIRTLREWQVDGIILSTTQVNTEILEPLKAENYPIVLIDRQLPGHQSDAVVVDNKQGTLDAINHLVSLGHSKIGMFAIGPSHLSSIVERVEGYRHAMLANNLELDEDLVFEIPFDNVSEKVAQSLNILLDRGVTAVFMANNNLTAALLEWSRKQNINIPEQLAVVSFDDVSMFRFCHPPVTAVAQPTEAIGTEAVKRLLERIENKGGPLQPMKVVLNTELVVRESSKRPTEA